MTLYSNIKQSRTAIGSFKGEEGRDVIKTVSEYQSGIQNKLGKKQKEKEVEITTNSSHLIPRFQN